MSSMKDYLKKYMSSTADSTHEMKKKRKKKKEKQDRGVATHIVDEDVDNWARIAKESDDDEFAPVIVDADAETIAALKEEKAKFTASSWETIREGELRADEEGYAPRRRSPSSSLSPPPKRSRRRSPSASPPRRRRGSPSLSPPRKKRRYPSRSPSPRESSSSSNVRLSDGRSAGLQTGHAIRKDAERREAERLASFSALSASQTGRDAQTIYRDKHGKKVDLAAQRAELAEQRRKREAEEEKNMVWGKGLAQQAKAEDDARRLKEEAARPLAIYADDRGRNEELMEKDRWGDPMAFMLAKNKKKSKDRPVYKGPPPPPNRFGIPPGYRWDGVDRSNGFEATYFQSKNSRAALQLEAYKWSTEDM